MRIMDMLKATFFNWVSGHVFLKSLKGAKSTLPQTSFGCEKRGRKKVSRLLLTSNASNVKRSLHPTRSSDSSFI